MLTRLSAAAVLFVAAIGTGVATAGHTVRAVAGPYTGTIAFVRGEGDLYVIHADGSGLHRVTPPATHVLDESTFEYAWSPNGRQIAYIDSRRQSLWLVQSDGSKLRRLLPGSRLASTALTWSPDGRKIAIVSGSGIYVLPIQRPQPRLLRATRNFGADPDLAWSPRGNEIAYELAFAPTNVTGVSLIHPDGTGYRQLSRLGGWGPQWSADGTQLAFHVAFPLGCALCAANRAFAAVGADGKGLHLVTADAYGEYTFAWSPYGRRILYGGWRGGIYAIDSDGRNNRLVTSDSPPMDLGSKLAWSPDGHSIVYVSARGGLYEVGVNGGGEVQLTNTPDGDWAPSWVAH